MFTKIGSRWVGVLAAMCGTVPAFADIVGPITLYRLRRVGYEILNDGGPVVDEFSCGSENIGLFVGVASIVLAVILALSFRRVRLKMAGFVHGSLGWIKRRLVYVVIALLCISALVGGFYVLKQNLDGLLAIGYGKIYASEPGWKYPDEVPDKVRTILMNRLNLVKGDLQKAVDDSGLLMEPTERSYWQVTKPHYARESMSIMTRVLSDSEGLRRRCRGIPIEWLVDSISFRIREVPNDTIGDGITSSGSSGGAIGD